MLLRCVRTCVYGGPKCRSCVGACSAVGARSSMLVFTCEGASAEEEEEEEEAEAGSMWHKLPRPANTNTPRGDKETYFLK